MAHICNLEPAWCRKHWSYLCSGLHHSLLGVTDKSWSCLLVFCGLALNSTPMQPGASMVPKESKGKGYVAEPACRGQLS
eukprot:1160372-Pelagomonas_calceolata.AAC.1